MAILHWFLSELSDLYSLGKTPLRHGDLSGRKIWATKLGVGGGGAWPPTPRFAPEKQGMAIILLPGDR